VAHELNLGPVLRWHVTSHSSLEDAMYRYDALGRLQQNQLRPEDDDISAFLRLGPLGTALAATGRPRALLIDELDKSDLDLPGDLLNALDRGEFTIPELNRLKEPRVEVREVDSDTTHTIEKGRILCSVFPFVVMTSNGERDFPAPFLRRCVRARLGLPTEQQLIDIVTSHFDDATVAKKHRQLIKDFAQRISDSPAGQARLAVDQLLNAVFLVSREAPPQGDERRRVLELLQRELDRS
jgi:MoxR-like ATPase